MSTGTQLMDVAAYRRLSAPPDGWYELHHGALVKVTRPSHRHYRIQQRLADLLQERAKGLGFVGIEIAFRAEPEFELRAADVAFVEHERWRSVPADDNLQGAPDLVIEVLSPSNTVSEMEEKATLCLRHGAKEFWVVNPGSRTVTVSLPDSVSRRYSAAESIPLTVFGEGSLPVSKIFEDPAQK